MHITLKHIIDMNQHATQQSVLVTKFAFTVLAETFGFDVSHMVSDIQWSNAAGEPVSALRVGRQVLYPDHDRVSGMGWAVDMILKEDVEDGELKRNCKTVVYATAWLTAVCEVYTMALKDEMGLTIAATVQSMSQDPERTITNLAAVTAEQVADGPLHGRDPLS